ncbi:MAG: TauD/TfdA family dioxygenase, partial [Pseudomonadota bacterium]
VVSTLPPLETEIFSQNIYDYEIASRKLPEPILDALLRLKHEDYCAVALRRCELYDSDGQTAEQAKKLAVLLTIASGTQPFSQLDMNRGELVSTLTPVNGRELEQSSSGMTENYPHIDTGSAPGELTADVISLVVQRAEASLSTEHFFVPIKSVVEKLSYKVRNILHQPRFVFRPTDAYRHSPFWQDNELVASVLSGSFVDPEVRYDSFVTTFDKESEAALAIFSDNVQNSIVRLRTSHGLCIIFDNRRCLHGRSAIDGTCNSPPRLVHRVWGIRNPRPLKPFQSAAWAPVDPYAIFNRTIGDVR